jgi:hypothetical protein
MRGGKNAGCNTDKQTPSVLPWLWLVLSAVFFTPTIRLPGDIPLRIDDLIVAGIGAMMLARAILRMRVGRFDGVTLALSLMAVTMPLSAFLASQYTTLPIGAKEYLDLIRPVKFVVLYLALRSSDFESGMETLRRTFRAAIAILLGCALIQFFLLNPGSGGPIVSIFLSFTSLNPDQARSYFGIRPFATFQTPTDLGYVMTVFLVGAMSMGNKRRWGSRIACLIGLVLSGTRTFLFALPVIFFIFSALREGKKSAKFKAIIWSGFGIALAAMMILVAFPYVNPSFATNITRTTNALTTADYSEDDSIAVRLQKLELVVYTWNHARYFGVASRSMLGPAADSEYVFTFNRYGLVGMACLLGIYLAALSRIRALRKLDPRVYQFTVLVLFATFIYGFTQGALIDTRVGVLPIAVVGIAVSKVREARRASGGNQLSSAAEGVL